VPNVILTRGEDENGSEAEEIGSLVTIQKRAEIALVSPERDGLMREVHQDAKRSDRDNPGGEESQLEARNAQFEFLGWDAVKPAQTGDETGEATKGNPRLRSNGSGQFYPEVVL